MLETITQTKFCPKCKTTKLSNLFNICKNRKDGLQTQCISCAKLHYQANKDRVLLRNRNYYQANKNIILEQKHEYYINNQEKMENRNKMYYQNNIDKVREYRKTPRAKGSQKNTDHKKRCLKKQGDVTTKQLIELEQNAKVCYWCNTSLKGKKIHVDHYHPLSKGGDHTFSNLVVSCAKCNLKKSCKDPIVFANSIGRLL